MATGNSIMDVLTKRRNMIEAAIRESIQITTLLQGINTWEEFLQFRERHEKTISYNQARQEEVEHLIVVVEDMIQGNATAEALNEAIKEVRDNESIKMNGIAGSESSNVIPAPLTILDTIRAYEDGTVMVTDTLRAFVDQMNVGDKVRVNAVAIDLKNGGHKVPITSLRGAFNRTKNLKRVDFGVYERV